jgi:hypothetical protein
MESLPPSLTVAERRGPALTSASVSIWPPHVARGIHGQAHGFDAVAHDLEGNLFQVQDESVASSTRPGSG